MYDNDNMVTMQVKIARVQHSPAIQSSCFKVGQYDQIFSFVFFAQIVLIVLI